MYLEVTHLPKPRLPTPQARSHNKWNDNQFRRMTPARLERATFGLGIRRSILLSYGAVCGARQYSRALRSRYLDLRLAARRDKRHLPV